uniref:Uncharacterized protein n=1 Tax=Craspedostauros australis TaxID=1486917 RepID=A0A7R9WNR9_9STRA
MNTTYGEDLAIASDADKRVAVIINSAAWEILSEKIPPQDNNFTSSMRMYREVITWFRQSYPNVTLIWKLPQAFHLHAADAVHARPAQVTRLKHASIANAKYLHGQQRALMEELGVPVLDLWNASYLSGHRHRNGDAVHYETQQNHYFIDMYYIDPKMKQLGKHRRERGRIL